MIQRFWAALAQQLGATGRSVLFVASIALLALAAFCAFWLSRTEYETLFADLTPQDSAAMTAELDRLKIPYVVGERTDASGESAGTILVDKNEVLRTRMKLMGKEIPLHGAVGFELFNNNDLGMTEFAQKINYQRALQGELTRTIMSLAEVREARVLLALPEQGLFKQATVRPKASVTLSMKKGQGLRAEQVAGIQRLVSAAVPGISPQDVTIVDRSGVALTRNSGGSNEADDAGSGRLDLKKETEAYLARKATVVLERALGAGQALASVDVVLNMDRVQVKTDEVIGAPGKPGAAPTGVVTRQRETSRDVGAPLNTTSSGGSTASAGGSSQQEVEYALGHRVEQVMSQPGSVRRVQVAVVVKQALQPAQHEQLRQMVAASVGASLERGDTVVVQTIAGFVASPTSAAAADASGVPDVEARVNVKEDASSHRGTPARWPLPLPMPSTLALLLVVVILSAWAIGRAIKAKAKSTGVPLSEAERLEALAKVRAWMQPQAGASRPPNARTAQATSPDRQPAGATR